MTATFTVLITVQCLVVALHDWVNIPGWTHGRQMLAVLGRNKLVVATLINCVFRGTAVFFAIQFWHQAKPDYVLDYWILYCGVTVLSAIAIWAATASQPLTSRCGP